MLQGHTNLCVSAVREASFIWLSGLLVCLQHFFTPDNVVFRINQRSVLLCIAGAKVSKIERADVKGSEALALDIIRSPFPS